MNARAETVLALVENESGTLNRLTSLFRRKMMSLDSLAVGDCEKEGLSRLSLVVHADPGAVDQVVAQLGKLLDVIEVEHVSDQDAVQRELALVRVLASAEQRREILEIAQIMDCTVAYLGRDSITLQCAATPQQLAHLFSLLEPYGIDQIVRSGVVAIRKESNS